MTAHEQVNYAILQAQASEARKKKAEASYTEALEQDETGRERELKGRFAPRLVALAAAICPDSKVRRKRSARGRRRASAPSLHTTRPPLARSTRAAPFRAHPPPRRRLHVLAAPCWGAQGPEHRHGNTKPGLACCPVGGGGGVDGHRFPCPLALCRAEKPGTYPHLMAVPPSMDGGQMGRGSGWFSAKPLPCQDKSILTKPR